MALKIPEISNFKKYPTILLYHNLKFLKDKRIHLPPWNGFIGYCKNKKILQMLEGGTSSWGFLEETKSKSKYNQWFEVLFHPTFLVSNMGFLTITHLSGFQNSFVHTPKTSFPNNILLMEIGCGFLQFLKCEYISSTRLWIYVW